MRVFLTGGTGFVGYNLAAHLKREGHDIVCLIRRTSNTTFLERVGGVEYVLGDLADGASLRDAVQAARPEAVVHLAGAVTAVRREGYFAVNTEGTRNLVEAVGLAAPALKRFVYVSSLSAGGPTRPGYPRTEQDEDRPVTHYGRSKKAAEDILLAYREELPSVILRPAAVYGPADIAVLGFFRAAARGISVGFLGRDLALSMIYVEDLTTAVVRALESSLPSGDLFYVSDGTEYRLMELHGRIARAVGTTVKRIRVPRFFLFPPAAVAEAVIRLRGRPGFFNWQKTIEAVQPAWLCSPRKLETRTGFHPRYDLDDGARATVAWYRQQGWI